MFYMPYYTLPANTLVRGTECQLGCCAQCVLATYLLRWHSGVMCQISMVHTSNDSAYWQCTTAVLHNSGNPHNAQHITRRTILHEVRVLLQSTSFSEDTMLIPVLTV